MNIDAIDEYDAKRIATAKVCEELPIDEWCEEGSVLFALRKLTERVKDIEKYKTLIDVLAIRVSELEKEVEKL